MGNIAPLRQEIQLLLFADAKFRSVLPAPFRLTVYRIDRWLMVHRLNEVQHA
jgi:hypothetical protein